MSCRAQTGWEWVFIKLKQRGGGCWSRNMFDWWLKETMICLIELKHQIWSTTRSGIRAVYQLLKRKLFLDWLDFKRKNSSSDCNEVYSCFFNLNCLLQMKSNSEQFKKFTLNFKYRKLTFIVLTYFQNCRKLQISRQ